MKRKVKFQEGGSVEQPATDSKQRARDRARARRRAATQREIDRLNPGQTSGEAERRAGRGVPERRPDFTTDERGTTRRGAATGREVVPSRQPSVPTAQGATPRQIPLFPSSTPRIADTATRAARRFIPGLGFFDAVSPTSLEAGARFEEENLRQARLDAMRDALPERPDIPTEMRNALPARPDIPAERRAARPRPAPRRELTMEEIRALRSGERAPRTSEERALLEGLRDLPLPRQRMSEADMLNERELQRIRAERMAEEQMGGSGNIGAASARERGEQVGPTGQYNMKKGGRVPAPKKMMKGGIVAKPKSKAKPVGKPMPFKKGGAIKKGKK